MSSMFLSENFPLLIIRIIMLREAQPAPKKIKSYGPCLPQPAENLDSDILLIEISNI